MYPDALVPQLSVLSAHVKAPADQHGRSTVSGYLHESDTIGL